MSSLGSLRRNVHTSDSELCAAERWVEARTSCHGGVVLCAISSHAHSIRNVHRGFVNRLSVACGVPSPIPSDGVARSVGEGRGASGPVHHGRRWSRWYCFMAKCGSLLQGRPGVGYSGSCPSGQAGLRALTDATCPRIAVRAQFMFQDSPNSVGLVSGRRSGAIGGIEPSTGFRSRLVHGANARLDEEITMPNQALVVQYRDAMRQDADSIAALHADSWQRHYRGAYLDSYLDGDVITERQQVWRSRLAEPQAGQLTVLAHRGNEIVGFAHTILDEDSQWGCLLENLHVTSELKRNRIGSHLLSETAQRLLRLRPTGSLHLWVLDQNTAAQAFYGAEGGTRVETQLRGPFPGGGRALGHCYYWSNPERLVVRSEVMGSSPRA